MTTTEIASLFCGLAAGVAVCGVVSVVAVWLDRTIGR